MRRMALGLLILLSLLCGYNPVGAQTGSSHGVKFDRAEISRFLGKWEGTLEQRKKRTKYSRTLRMDIEEADGGGYRAVVFRGLIKPNVGLLHTTPPSEKEYKVKFEKKDGIPCMRIKMGRDERNDYVFFLRGESLYCENTSADERTCSLSRPKQ